MNASGKMGPERYESDNTLLVQGDKGGGGRWKTILSKALGLKEARTVLGMPRETVTRGEGGLPANGTKEDSAVRDLSVTDMERVRPPQQCWKVPSSCIHSPSCGCSIHFRTHLI